MPPPRYFLLISLFFWAVHPCSTGFAANNTNDDVDQPWTLLGGYGFSHKGVGDTKVHIETLDFITRYEIVEWSGLGKSWYRGAHTLILEFPFSHVVVPATSPMIGATFLGSWLFTYNSNFQPYILWGGGVIYTEAAIKGLGSNWNANWQVGLGLRHYTAVGDFFYEYRFHHISNTGIKDPNDPINSSKIFIGFRF